ncbi:MAG: hypothetical protein K0S09_577 [Sphingobacteriaceae bacterium]|jgi:hypothetical protein|nr:hypothetical protein [Sphingobacteriaceae bacterium]
MRLNLLYILSPSLLMFGLSVNAQKLADIQEKGVLAPEKVKVDGKATEWPASFQAFNKATMVSYTIANDAKNLYLVVQSNDKVTTNKIMRGGITFAFNLEGKKKENEGPRVTFPVPGNSGSRTFSRPAGAAPGTPVRIEMQGNPDQMMKRMDSAMAESNKRQIAALKEIKVIGLKGVTDSLISIYNEYGVKAMAGIDDKGVFTYELAVPLDALGLSDNSKEFAYNIKLNGLQSNIRINGEGPPAGGGGGERVIVMNTMGGGGGMPRGMSDMMSMMTPTFFWGKYSLVKP